MLFEWIRRLQAAKIHFTMTTVRDGAVMLEVSVPGQHWEIEFFPDGTIEIERYVSQGVTGVTDGQDALDDFLRQFADKA